METNEIGIKNIPHIDILVVGMGAGHIHEIMAELVLRNEHPNLIVVSDNNIAYNGTGLVLTKEQEMEILVKALPVELRPSHDLLKSVEIDLKPMYNPMYYKMPRKSDDQPWAKLNRYKR